MSLPVRVGTLLVAFLAVVGGAIFVVIHFFLTEPAVITAAGSGSQVSIVLQEDAQNTVSTHPDWVSYFIQDPSTKKWVHTTLFKVPAGATVHVTILGYDGCTPLRNPFWGRVTGTIGGTETIDGKPVKVVDSWRTCSVGHTFSIPGIGLNVPMGSPPTVAEENNLCGTSPCTSGPHSTMKFSFVSPKTPVAYSWQCRVPCGGGFGTVSLVTSHGAGAGEGPAPIWSPPGAELTAAQQTAPWAPGKPLVVQVIGQQWRFTYRYPQFGGFETTELMLPQGQWAQFNVTSLDVIHSFWAYQLGVKADANPNVDNVAYTKPEHVGPFTVRCAELCGLWHGAMFDYGKVMTVPQFQAWAGATKASLADVTRLLPAFATTYDPTVIPAFRSGPVMKKLGLTSAGGFFYPPEDPVQP